VCSESHYSIIFSTNLAITQTGGDSIKKFDLVYYDELARQEDDIILTVDKTKSAGDTKYTIPIDSVIRTKWKNAHVGWNGRTVIL
jgi:hypothetical protein